MLLKCCNQYASKFEKLSTGHRTQKSVFFPILKKDIDKQCSINHTVALILHTRKVMHKIIQARLQQYVNCELPDVQGAFRKGSQTRDQIANSRRVIAKTREFQKTFISALLTMPKPYFCFIDHAKAFDCVDHSKLWNILQDMGISDQLTCFLRNMYVSQETTVSTGHETTDRIQIRRGVHQGCILSPCLFNLYAEHIV